MIYISPYEWIKKICLDRTEEEDFYTVYGFTSNPYPYVNSQGAQWSGSNGPWWYVWDLYIVVRVSGNKKVDLYLPWNLLRRWYYWNYFNLPSIDKTSLILPFDDTTNLVVPMRSVQTRFESVTDPEWAKTHGQYIKSITQRVCMYEKRIQIQNSKTVGDWGYSGNSNQLTKFESMGVWKPLFEAEFISIGKIDEADLLAYITQWNTQLNLANSKPFVLDKYPHYINMQNILADIKLFYEIHDNATGVIVTEKAGYNLKGKTIACQLVRIPYVVNGSESYIINYDETYFLQGVQMEQLRSEYSGKDYMVKYIQGLEIAKTYFNEWELKKCGPVVSDSGW